jgi:hypothetical protein
VRIEPTWPAVLVFHRIGGNDALTRTDRANGADAALAGTDRVLRYNEPFPAVFALDDARDTATLSASRVYRRHL